MPRARRRGSAFGFEPTNARDPGAVRVVVCGEHVGYVPRACHPRLSGVAAAGAGGIAARGGTVL